MITSIVTVCGGIAVMLGSGVAISTALTWMNNFDVTLSGKKSHSSNKGRGNNHPSARDRARERVSGGGRGPGSGLDMFE